MNQIGQTILEQIQESSIPNEPYLNFMKAVHASQLVALENGMQFRVRGDKFSGKIVITLNAADLYDIEFWNVKLGLDEYKQDDCFICEKVDEIKDVYNSQLAELLWNKIVIV
jgi:hypothetical protein